MCSYITMKGGLDTVFFQISRDLRAGAGHPHDAPQAAAEETTPGAGENTEGHNGEPD